MRNRIVVTALLLALVALARPALAEPKITFGHTEHDFGRVYQNESLVHVFPFTNTGDRTLLIKEVKGS
jgi:hypothetical protein